MPDNFIAGTGGYVKFGSVNYQFNKWRISIAANNKKFFAFPVPFQRTLPGPNASTITCEGFHDVGNMPLVTGALVELHLGWDAGLEIVVIARVGDGEYGNELKTGDEPGGTISRTFDSHGAFTLSFP